ncbi:MAG TPA: amino acid ABC transporter ATP-binding protein [Candidatus Polarisedimenticolia bacterium]|nr:amino acid ABC transporter ATP-binding protein [Candidatus Polarisedimenticolia bacterium]
MTANPGIDLTLEGLRKVYDGHTILDDVTLSIAAGTTVALIGPSGGGKSTLLRCLNGLTPFEGGSVRVGEHRLGPGPVEGPNRAVAQQIRRLLGMIFQDFQLFPHLTAIENLIEAPVRVLGSPAEAARAEADRLLDRVGLSHRKDAYPNMLSGGQKQRVAIARALAMHPRGLLCDEITSALDPELKGEVLAVVEDLRRDGITLVMVTHEIGFARRAADRVLVLDHGAILEDGPPREVLERPKTARTRQFLSLLMG